MFVTFVIGLTFFVISFSLSLLTALSTFSKRIGVNSLGVTPVLLFLLAPCFFLTLELAIFYTVPDAWGTAYIFVVMNALLLVMQYIFFVGSAIFTPNSIYRLTKFLVWKKHTYDDVIGYVMKKSSGQVSTRLRKHTVVTFDVEIYFNDNQFAFFSTKDPDNTKVVYIKLLLEEHNCPRNGRIKTKTSFT